MISKDFKRRAHAKLAKNAEVHKVKINPLRPLRALRDEIGR
jgi:hypothetical protein